MDVHKSPRVAKSFRVARSPRVATHNIEASTLRVKSFHDFLRLLYAVFLDPPFSILAWFIDWGYLLGCSLTQWVKVTIAKQAPVHLHKRVESSDLNCGRFLGQGCSGIIYEATCSRGRNTSLLARKAFPAVPADVFESEAASLVELDHPNIVKVLGWTVDRRSCSLVMDYMKYDLFSVVEKRKEAMRYGAQVNFSSTVPIPLREAVHIMLQIAEGVKYVHDQRLAHGDLKPNNVLVDSKSGLTLVKVTDFGLTETKKRSTTLLSHEARCLQVLKWKAPHLFEDLLGSSTEDSEDNWTEMFPDLEVVKTSHASSSGTMGGAESKMQLADAYSFALTCSYILGARVPHDSSLGLSKLRHQITSGARPHLPSECPKTLTSLISECWDNIPSRRPAFIDICKKMRAVQMELIRSGDMAIASSEREQPTNSRNDYPEPVTDKYQDLQEKLEKPKVLTEWEHFFPDIKESELKIKEKIEESTYEGEWIRGDGKFHSVLIKDLGRRNFAITEPMMHFFNSKGTEANFKTSRVLRPLGGTFLDNGRLALIYERYWGDLTDLILLQTQQKNKVPPFELEMAIDIMLQIAEGLVELHELGLVHRDVNSMNVVVRDLEKYYERGNHGFISCALTGYEASKRYGEECWQAPEIRERLGMDDLSTMEFTRPMDVFCYGMTCYEILTGILLGDFYSAYGRRLELPAGLHPQLRELVERCWHPHPRFRPTSQEIVLLLKHLLLK